MIPVLTPEEMRAVDAASPIPEAELIRRAGTALGRAALEYLGGSYGRRVVVVAGKGNNGADGRVAAEWLARRGVRVRVIAAADAPRQFPDSDLVIDAAYGTGFRGDYDAPDPGDAFVLAADIPSGVDGLTGEACEGAVHADATVTFAALKPGLLSVGGEVRVADIGLDVDGSRTHVVEEIDVRIGLPARRRDEHKYDAAVLVVAGSEGMTGAAALTSRASLRAGAGYCRLLLPGVDASQLPASEVVAKPLPAGGWSAEALAAVERMSAAAVGPGLGREEGTVEDARDFIARATTPLVVDADGLFALGKLDEARDVLSAREAPTVLTPHDGEFARLAGASVGADRIGATRDLARKLGVTVLLKGSNTIVADPDGAVLVSTTGTPSLATAGTGDVLTGVVVAFLAMGLRPLRAGAFAAYVHGRAAREGARVGLIASDLVDLLPTVLSSRDG